MPALSDIVQFFRGQVFEKPTLPNTSFAGKTVVITGANTGLGFECAKQLVQLDASTIILGCRSVAKGNAAREKIRSEHKSEREGEDTIMHVWQMNMASYASVNAFAERLRTELPRIDALIANAGISTNAYRAAEGLESTMTVNVISTFLLAFLVLPQLKRTASQSKTVSHLTIVGSNVHAFASPDPLQHAPEAKIFQRLSDPKLADMAGRYFLSKLIVMLCVRQMAQVISEEAEKDISKEATVIINCPSPGWCKTELFREDDGGFWGRNMLKLIGREAEVGARTLTSAIAASRESHGQYLSECQVKRASLFVRSGEGRLVQQRVWNELVETIETISPRAIRNLKEL